jgi:hypothetical protein
MNVGILSLERRGSDEEKKKKRDRIKRGKSER